MDSVSIMNIGWVVFFIMSLSLVLKDEEKQKYLRTLGWLVVSFLAISFTYYFWIHEQSIVQSVLSFFGIFIALLFSYLVIRKDMLYHQTTILISISTGIILFVYTIPVIRITLLELVASETQMLLEVIGYSTNLQSSTDGVFIVFNGTEQPLRTEIVVACTGIGSIAIFSGFAVALDSLSWRMRLILAIGMSGVIYILNAIRNVFIAGAYGGQWFHIQPDLIKLLFGRDDEWVSYYIADRIIAQFGAVIILLLFALLIIHLVDEETELINEWVNTIEFVHKTITKR